MEGTGGGKKGIREDQKRDSVLARETPEGGKFYGLLISLKPAITESPPEG